jgi:hypothetical protein
MVGTIITGGQIRDLAGGHRLLCVNAVRPDAKIKTRTFLPFLAGGGGIGMATASVEVSGPDAERLAGELRAVLVTANESGGSVSQVEVERSAELVIAIIGLVFSGVGTARTIWDWWHGRRPEGVRVRILLDDGTQVDLSDVDQQQLEIAFARRTPPGD